MTVLLIEPDARLNRTYAEALRMTGHHVWAVTQAQTAIQALDQTKPDMIILEPQLRDHGGIELLYELRSYGDWQTIPVILHTFIPADSLQPSRQSLETLGVSAYLYKPQTTLRQLLALVSSILQTAKV